ncbi:ankyrin repeat protein [archaeon]|nr:MAG: ankyrin repeat protein [archaeon]
MSEAKVRQACIHNRIEELEVLVKARANVCSIDEWGLTALHYAVWNGHVECVKLLVFNSHGVDSKGQKTTCLNMKSCIGLTGTHKYYTNNNATLN